MKKLLAFILLCVLLLASCARSRGAYEFEESDIYWVSYNSTTRYDGMYFIKSIENENVLCYADFGNCKQAVVCAKPNCPHTDPDSCYALGVTNGNGPVLPRGDKIYWLYVEGYDLAIYSANVDGTGRKSICTIEDRISGGNTLCAVGDKLYFIAEDQYYDERGLAIQPHSCYIYSYGFDDSKLIEHCSVSQVFSDAQDLSCFVDGIWNGSIYLNVFAKKGNGGAYHELKYDIENDKLTKSDITPWQISGGYMILLEGSNVRIIHESGREYLFEKAGASEMYGACVVNGKLFIKDKVIDIETGKCYSRLDDVIPGPHMYRDGKYLIIDRTKWTFEMVPEKKVIGDEIE
jgi:lipoprotein